MEVYANVNSPVTIEWCLCDHHKYLEMPFPPQLDSHATNV